MKKEIYSYKNTTSSAGQAEHITIETNEIVRANYWCDYYGNPSWVYHMENGDTHYLVGDYGGSNFLYKVKQKGVKRRKDLFNRFA